MAGTNVTKKSVSKRAAASKKAVNKNKSTTKAALKSKMVKTSGKPGVVKRKVATVLLNVFKGPHLRAFFMRVYPW
jgi:hypothetical protein